MRAGPGQRDRQTRVGVGDPGGHVLGPLLPAVPAAGPVPDKLLPVALPVGGEPPAQRLPQVHPVNPAVQGDHARASQVGGDLPGAAAQPCLHAGPRAGARTQHPTPVGVLEAARRHPRFSVHRPGTDVAGVGAGVGDRQTPVGLTSPPDAGAPSRPVSGGRWRPVPGPSKASSPTSVATVFDVLSLRELGLPRPAGWDFS